MNMFRQLHDTLRYTSIVIHQPVPLILQSCAPVPSGGCDTQMINHPTDHKSFHANLAKGIAKEGKVIEREK